MARPQWTAWTLSDAISDRKRTRIAAARIQRGAGRIRAAAGLRPSRDLYTSVMNSACTRFGDFAALYADVTVELTRFGSEAHGLGQITTDELNWWLDVMQRFTLEFCRWGNPPQAPVDEYLSIFEGRASRSMRLAAHAFLHVGYDLPRAIADSLIASPLPRYRLRSIFVRPAPLFRQIFVRRAREGSFGLLARPLGYLKPAEILSYWLLSLRAVAWIHGESLADAPARGARELELARGLLDAGKAARAYRGILDVPALDNSTLLQVTTPVMLWDIVPAASTIAALSLTGIALRLRNEVLARRIGYFGARVFVETTRSMGAIEPTSRSS